jgi:4-amino-4-deoxy-L-arabinose transferase-like glycosyltransferase
MPLPTRLQKRLLYAILAFALLLSVSVALTGRGDTPSSLHDDAADYHRIAVGMLDHYTYDNISRAPFYPTFVAVVYAIAGPRPVAVYVAQALLFVLTLFLTYLVVVKVTRRHSIGLLAVAMCAVWPMFHMYVKQELTEIVAGFTVVAAALALISAAERPCWWRAAVAGVLIAVAVLTKAVFLPIIFLGPLLIVKRKALRETLPCALLATLVGVLVLLPWSIRNYIVTDGCIVPVSTLAGLTLWYGNHPDAYTTSSQYEFFELHGFPKRYGATRAAVEQDRRMMRQGFALIREDPLRTAGLFAIKFTSLWFGRIGARVEAYDRPMPNIAGYTVPKRSLLLVPAYILAIAGFILLKGTARSRVYPVLLFPIIASIAYTVLYALERYATSLYYFELALVSVTVYHLFTRVRTSLIRR